MKNVLKVKSTSFEFMAIKGRFTVKALYFSCLPIHINKFYSF
jgi:hypothetical protein